jgi:DNA-binding CsgD family transcriptional regulator
LDSIVLSILSLTIREKTHSIESRISTGLGMSLIPRWLKQLFQKQQEGEDRAYSSDTVGFGLSNEQLQPAHPPAIAGLESTSADKKTNKQELEIFPEEPSIRKTWFSLTIRERQVVALVCMGYRNYEIASILGVSHATIQTHLQKVFRKFGLRSRNEIREALESWSAEEWWNHHHY